MVLQHLFIHILHHLLEGKLQPVGYDISGQKSARLSSLGILKLWVLTSVRNVGCPFARDNQNVRQTT